MRVAVVSGFPPDPQGEANYAGLVLGALATHRGESVRVRVHAHVHAAEPAAQERADGIEVVRSTGAGSRRRRGAAVQRLLPAIRAWGADVCHLNGTHTPLYGGLYGEPTVRLITGLRDAGIPSVVTLHSTWFLDELDALWRGKGLPRPAARIMSRHYSRYMRRLVAAAAEVRVATAGDGGDALARFADDHGLPRARLLVEAHPCRPVADADIAPREAAARRTLGIPGRLIVTVGYVRPDKNLLSLLEAAPAVLAAHHDAHVVIAGEPVGADGRRYAAELEAMRRASAHAERIHLRFGFLDEPAFDAMVDAAHVLVVPYARSIGPSGPVHHALGRGKVVLATDIGHNAPLRDTIALYRPGRLTEALAALLADPAHATRLGDAARRYAATHTFPGMADAYLATYRRLRDGAHGARRA